jgi:hypothetical protein
LDSLVLSLLHRHREDVMPTGQTFSAPTTPTRQSLSRSSSFRRGNTPTAPPSAFARRAGTPTRPLSPSPLRPLSPSVQRPTESEGDSVLSSPFGSSLSVNAHEFRPRVSTPSSPQPTWSFQASPLGTPKFSPAAGSNSGSYFPTVPTPSSTKTPAIPRDPWGPPSISTSTSSESSAEEPRDSFSPLVGQATVEEWPPPPGYDGQIQWWEASKGDVQPVRGEAGGLSGDGAYLMTPFDVLCSIFAGSNISPAELEDALARNGWDVNQAVEWITSRPVDDLSEGLLMSGTEPTITRAKFLPASGSRPLVLPRESISPGSRSPGATTPRWGSRPGTPVRGVSSSSPAGGTQSSNRICRYYLQGNCLRSDCRYVPSWFLYRRGFPHFKRLGFRTIFPRLYAGESRASLT